MHTSRHPMIDGATHTHTLAARRHLEGQGIRTFSIRPLNRDLDNLCEVHCLDAFDLGEARRALASTPWMVAEVRKTRATVALRPNFR